MAARKTMVVTGCRTRGVVGDAAVICQFVWHYDKCICCHYIGYFIASGGSEAACKIVQEVVKVWRKFVSLAATITTDPALFLVFIFFLSVSVPLYH